MQILKTYHLSLPTQLYFPILLSHITVVFLQIKIMENTISKNYVQEQPESDTQRYTKPPLIRHVFNH